MKVSSLDSTYFSDKSWNERVIEWQDDESAATKPNPFLDGNLRVIRQILNDDETGLRMVINIGADALLKFLDTGEYKNIYENPVIGGTARQPSKERIEVDDLLGFSGGAKNYYFGAAALGGTGVRFYGEYCMVIREQRVHDDTQLLDRDSFDLLLPPLVTNDKTKRHQIANYLKGKWGEDLVEMLIMKMLPNLRGARHLITVGHVSELVMSDQEFVEIHLENTIRWTDLEEIRQSPDEVAIESNIVSRKRNWQSPSLVEIRWVQQRHKVQSALNEAGLRYRIVTLHGKGYQWR